MAAETCSLIRFELGLPLFADLDLGELLGAQALLAQQDIKGMTQFVGTLAKASKTQTIRKLSAIWTATELELSLAEVDAKALTALYDRAKSKPFAEAFRDTMDFQGELWTQLGLLQSSSGAETTIPPAPKKSKGGRSAV